MIGSKRFVRASGSLLLLLGCLALLSGVVHAYRQTITLPNGEQAVIDWGVGELVATGQAVPPSNATTDGQKRLLARRGAVLDAQRNLLETLAGINVTSDSTMVNLMANDVVRTQVEGAVQGAAVVAEAWDAESEIYTVEMRVPLAAARDAAVPQATIIVTARPETPTGLVIDVRELRAVPSLLFRIFTEAGVEITAAASGYYVTALPGGLGSPVEDAAADERVADRAWVIRAVGLMDNQIDLIVSEADGEQLRRFLLERDFFRDGRTLLVMN